jgi:hypothetical protein
MLANAEEVALADHPLESFDPSIGQAQPTINVIRHDTNGERYPIL